MKHAQNILLLALACGLAPSARAESVGEAIFAESVALRENMNALYTKLNVETRELQLQMEHAQLQRQLYAAPTNPNRVAEAEESLRLLEGTRTAPDTERAQDLEHERQLATAVLEAAKVHGRDKRLSEEMRANAEAERLRAAMLEIASSVNTERRALAKTATMYDADFTRVARQYARVPEAPSRGVRWVDTYAAFLDSTFMYTWFDASSNELASARVSIKSTPSQTRVPSVLPGQTHTIEYEDEEACRVRAGAFQVDFVLLGEGWQGARRVTQLAHELVDMDRLAVVDLTRPQALYPGIDPDAPPPRQIRLDGRNP